MDVSFMYHGFGLRTVECSRTEYKDNGIVLNVQTRDDKLCCPECKSKTRYFKLVLIVSLL